MFMISEKNILNSRISVPVKHFEKKIMWCNSCMQIVIHIQVLIN